MRKEARVGVLVAGTLILLSSYYKLYGRPLLFQPRNPVNDSWTINDDQDHVEEEFSSRGSTDDLLTWPGDHNLTREKVMPEYLKMETPDSPPDDPPLKKILLWNDMYGKPHYFFGLGREPFVRAGCRVNTCYTTADRLRFPLDQLDAVAWHFRAQDQTLPSQRSTHTRYVFVMQESPMNLFGDLHHYDEVFNWTLTYRLDSDFPSPHGFVTQRSQHSSHDGDGRVDVAELVANKTKLAAWFVSNCHSSSGRESLARTLQNYFPLDIYGKCGVLECPRVHQNQCYTMLQKDYKFYMAFENSLCRDYITEKFFGVLEYYVVPVVWGSGNYTTQAPPHSFIDASRFPSVYDLAQYLLYLHHNDTAYMEYFKWKVNQEVVLGWASRVLPWCALCERLHTDNTTQIYHDLHTWFVTEATCSSASQKDVALFVHGENRHLT